MNKRIAIICIVAISIISFYYYFTRPINFSDMANLENKEDIENIMILAHYRQGSFGSSKELIIRDKKEISELMHILDNYKYSKKFSSKNIIPGDSNIIYGHTDSFIQIMITSNNSINQIKRYDFSISSNNTINIDFSIDNHWESEYRTIRSEENIFEELSNWVKPLIK